MLVDAMRGEILRNPLYWLRALIICSLGALIYVPLSSGAALAMEWKCRPEYLGCTAGIPTTKPEGNKRLRPYEQRRPYEWRTDPSARYQHGSGVRPFYENLPPRCSVRPVITGERTRVVPTC